jgi:hypothetical protein
MKLCQMIKDANLERELHSQLELEEEKQRES